MSRKVELKTKRYFVCPECGKSEFFVEHLLDSEMGKVGPWYCRECGSGWMVSQNGDGVEVEKCKDVGKTEWILLEIPPQEHPIYLRVSSFRHWKREDDWVQYWVEEGTCPVNLLRDVDEIWVNGQEDPHGILELVSVHDERGDARPVGEAATAGVYV